MDIYQKKLCINVKVVKVAPPHKAQCIKHNVRCNTPLEERTKRFELSKIFNEEKINLTGMNVRVSKQGKATIAVKFEIHSKEQLSKIISKIRNIEGIIDIERTAG